MDYSPETQRKIHSFPPVYPKEVTPKTTVEEAFSINYCKSFTDFSLPQSVAIPGTEKPGYSPIYRSSYSPDRLVSAIHPDVRTIYDGFKLSVHRFPKRPMLGERVFNPNTGEWSKSFHFLTYEQVAQKRTNFGSGLIHVLNSRHGLGKTEKFIVSLFSSNRSHWAIADLACHAYNLPNVSLYDTLGPTASEYILEVTESPVVICSLDKVPVLLKLKPQLPHLLAIVSMDPLNSAPHNKPGQSPRELLQSVAEQAGVGLYDFDEITTLGAMNVRPHNPPAPTDLFTLSFTSGTTGNPKGVALTHDTVMAVVANQALESMREPHGTYQFSFLPLAHIYERSLFCTGLVLGFTFGYPHGTVLTLFEDIKLFRPTRFCGVPRLFNKLENAIKEATIAKEGLAGKLSRAAVEAKTKKLEETGDPTHFLWDRLVSNKVRHKIGLDRLQGFVTGSAPLAAETMKFLGAVFSSQFYQGYGLTESFSGVNLTRQFDPVLGSCGPINCTCEMRLRDVPEMNYTSSDPEGPKGELMLRGPQIFKGYWKNEEETAKAFDEDGFFHTGDIARIDVDGRVYIFDRVKNFFKLAQGEYIAPEKIENKYLSYNPLLNQILCYGDSFQSYLVGLLGVDPVQYSHFLKEKHGIGINPENIEALNETFEVVEIRTSVLQLINHNVKPAKLLPYEMLKNVMLRIEPMTIDNNCLTPTFKIKRAPACKMFKAELDALYREGPLIEKISTKAKI